MSVRILATLLLSLFPLVRALSASDIPADAPISSLLESADNHLSKRETNDALVYYDVAISRDGENYLTYFKRGATYLSLGKSAQAIADFDKVLSIKPGFESALVQRAKIKARNGDWDGSKKDFLAQGKSASDLAQLEEARKASILAAEAEMDGKWTDCVIHASNAILVASQFVSMRKTRARCRLELGDTEHGINDLRHIIQVQPGMTDPHLQASATLFYGLSDTENGIDQLRKCLYYDPESKTCKDLYRREKTLEKQIAQVKSNLERKMLATALKTLLPYNGELGLVQEIKNDIEELNKAKTMVGKTPNKLLAMALGMTCKAYYLQKDFQRASPWCKEVMIYDEYSLYGLLSQAQQQMKYENFEAAINTLRTASKFHPDSVEVDDMLQDAENEFRRSKTKDYYKILGVPRDADELQLKSSYRRLTKLYHPDKAHKQGIPKEEAEKKMAAVNEAYEVLSNPELRQRFDRGDDPNSHEQHNHPFESHDWFPAGFKFASSGGGNVRYESQEYQFHFV